DGTAPAGNPNQTIELLADASLAMKSASGLKFTQGADFSKVYGLTIDGFEVDGILLDGVASMQIGMADGGENTWFDPIANGKGKMIIYGNGLNVAGAGIRITGVGATNNSVIASIIGTNATSDANLGNGIGVDLEKGASGNHIGPGSVGSGKVADGL